MRDTLRFFGLDAPTFRYTLRKAIDAGHLVPYRIYKAMTVKSAADSGFEVGREELDWSAMDSTTKDEFDGLFERSDRITRVRSFDEQASTGRPCRADASPCPGWRSAHKQSEWHAGVCRGIGNGGARGSSGSVTGQDSTRRLAEKLASRTPLCPRPPSEFGAPRCV